MRFQHWFPESTVEFAGISTGVCNATLAAYQTAWNGEKSHWLSNLETDSSPTLQLQRPCGMHLELHLRVPQSRSLDRRRSARPPADNPGRHRAKYVRACAA